MKLLKLLFYILHIFSYANFVFAGLEKNTQNEPSNKTLQCAPKNSTAKTTQAAQTEAGVCPDCEALKKSSLNALLKLPEFLNPLNVAKITSEDINNVESIISESLSDESTSAGYSTSIQSQENIEKMLIDWKIYLQTLKLCKIGKYNNSDKNYFQKTMKFFFTVPYDKSSYSSDPDTKLLAQYDSSKNPTEAQFQSLCQYLYKKQTGYYGYLTPSKKKSGQIEKSEMTGWLQNEILEAEKQTKKFTADLNIILNKQKMKPEVKKRKYPTWALESGAQKCGMTAEEAALIREYTRSFYKSLNPALRGAAKSSIGDDDLEYQLTTSQLASVVRIMNSGLSKVAAYQGTVYRGIRVLPAKSLSQHKVGGIIQFSTYVSTSVDRFTAEGFGRGNFLYIIQSKNGRKINAISNFKSEEEILFAPMSRFKITKVDSKKGATTFHLTEI